MGSSASGVMLKIWFSLSRSEVVSASVTVSGPVTPRTRNARNAMTKAGIDVQTWRLMCSWTSTLTI